MRNHPTLAITAGDPCGIGPEVILKSLAGPASRLRANLIVIGDLAVFEQTARRLQKRLPLWHIRRVTRSGGPSLGLRPRDPSPRDPEWWRRTPGPQARGGWGVAVAQTTAARRRGPPWGRAAAGPAGCADRPRLTFLDLEHREIFVPGRSSAAAGRASIAYLDTAIELARTHAIQAVVTAPVTKWAIERSCRGFVGQTEYLAKALQAREVVMMFISDALRIALLTRHVPLAQVPRAVTRATLETTLRLTHHVLQRDFRCRRPRLAVCGLNPHAGEGGLFGREECSVLLPVLRAWRRSGRVCDGPFAADGFFAQPMAYDAVICWYHDQGLIPFKMAARDRGCQLSVGLPIVRTSPDHGSALEIAGKGQAHPGSMAYALALAARLAR